MTLDELFEKSLLVAQELKDILKENGYTKASFAKVSKISRPTLDRLISGTINNKKTFVHHMQKILSILNVNPDELLLFFVTENRAEAIYSQNTQINHQMSEIAKKQYDILMNIVDLCSIYY